MYLKNTKGMQAFCVDIKTGWARLSFEFCGKKIRMAFFFLNNNEIKNNA